MRKTLLSCVAASALALACTATSFAAVSYGEKNAFTINYNAVATETAAVNTLDITAADAITAAGAQVTLLVVKGDNPSTISDGDILYIDQQASADAATEFANVGLLGEAALGVGTYTAKIGGSTGAIATATFTVAEDAPVVPDVKFKWGDVNVDGVADSADAINILTYKAGGASKVGAAAFDFDQEFSAGYKWGDVNVDGVADSADAINILTYKAGGASKVGASQYDFDADVTLPGLAK